jgi:hypothetical protein
MFFESIGGIPPSIKAIFDDISKLGGNSPSIYQNGYLSNFPAEKRILFQALEALKRGI